MKVFRIKNARFVAMGLALSLVSTAPTALLAQQSTTLAGTAKDQVKGNTANFTVRARDVLAGTIAGTTKLDAQANFTLDGLSNGNYVIELLNNGGRVVCTEGPFNMSEQPIKTDVIINCDKNPTGWLLLAAAAAAGVTAGVVVAGDDPAPVGVAPTSVSASR